MTSTVFSSEVNGFVAGSVICSEPSSHYEKMSDILDEESNDNDIKEECKTKTNHNIYENTTQVDFHCVIADHYENFIFSIKCLIDVFNMLFRNNFRIAMNRCHQLTMK